MVISRRQTTIISTLPSQLASRNLQRLVLPFSIWNLDQQTICYFGEIFQFENDKIFVLQDTYVLSVQQVTGQV